MVTDADLARLSQRAYSDTPTWSRGDVHACRTDFADGTTVVAFRGSDDLLNWLRDLRVCPQWHRQLGYCHAGFLAGALALLHQIAADTAGRRVIFTGHSLGGALALIMGALFILYGLTVVAIVTFGAPRPGFAKLARVLRRAPVLRLYRNGNDPVPRVPWLLGFYRTPGPQLPIGAAAADPIECHFIERYIAAPVPATPVLAEQPS